jgi:hypothetical protein
VNARSAVRHPSLAIGRQQQTIVVRQLAKCRDSFGLVVASPSPSPHGDK